VFRYLEADWCLAFVLLGDGEDLNAELSY